jgi:hypothetical protein
MSLIDHRLPKAVDAAADLEDARRSCRDEGGQDPLNPLDANPGGSIAARNCPATNP